VQGLPQQGGIKGNPKGPVMCGDCHVTSERLASVLPEAKNLTAPLAKPQAKPQDK
jgi:hypothetical protein